MAHLDLTFVCWPELCIKEEEERRTITRTRTRSRTRILVYFYKILNPGEAQDEVQVVTTCCSYILLSVKMKNKLELEPELMSTTHLKPLFRQGTHPTKRDRH